MNFFVGKLRPFTWEIIERCYQVPVNSLIVILVSWIIAYSLFSFLLVSENLLICIGHNGLFPSSAYEVYPFLLYTHD